MLNQAIVNVFSYHKLRIASTLIRKLGKIRKNSNAISRYKKILY